MKNNYGFENEMYEIVKTVNGYNIYRMKGTHGCYWVPYRKTLRGFVSHCTKTIKAAAAFCEQLA